MGIRENRIWVGGKIVPLSLDGFICSNKIEIELTLDVPKASSVKKISRIRSQLFVHFSLDENSSSCLKFDRQEKTNEILYTCNDLPEKIHIVLSRQGDFLIGEIPDAKISIDFEDENGDIFTVNALNLPERVFLCHTQNPQDASTRSITDIFDVTISIPHDIPHSNRLSLKIRPTKSAYIKLLKKIRDVQLSFENKVYHSEKSFDSSSIECTFFVSSGENDVNVIETRAIALIEITNPISGSVTYKVRPRVQAEVISELARIEIHTIDKTNYVHRATLALEGVQGYAEINDRLLEKTYYNVVRNIAERIWFETLSPLPGKNIDKDDLIGAGRILLDTFFTKKDTYKRLKDANPRAIEIISSTNEYIYPFEMFADDELWGIKYEITNATVREGSLLQTHGPDIGLFGVRNPPLRVLIIVSEITETPKKSSYYKALKVEKNSIVDTLTNMKINGQNLFDIKVISIKKDNSLWLEDLVKNTKTIKTGKGTGSKRTNKDVIFQELERDYDIIHFVGESHIYAIGSRNKIAFLIDENVTSLDKQLTPENLAWIFRNGFDRQGHIPFLLFANFCNAVFYLPQTAIHIDNPFNKLVAPWVGAFIGPFVYIPSGIASAVSSRFYKFLFEPLTQGLPTTKRIAEALRDAKRDLYINSTRKDVSYLFFTVFGSSSLRFKLKLDT